jgi:hypothetical protein
LETLTAAWQKLTTSRVVATTLIPAASFVFFVSLFIASIPYYSGKPVNLKDAVISSLESPSENPRGYLTASDGTALCWILLFPAASLFRKRLRTTRNRFALAGPRLFATGLFGCVAIGCLAPITEMYSPVPIYQSEATFVALSAGILGCTAAALVPVWRFYRSLGFAMALLMAFEFAMLAFLIYLVVGPEFLPG